MGVKMPPSNRQIFRDFVVHHLTDRTEKLIGHTLEYYMNKDGECHPSISTLMAASGIKKEETLSKYLKRIEAKKAFFVERRKGRNNTYKVLAEAIQSELSNRKTTPIERGYCQAKVPPQEGGGTTPTKRGYFKRGYPHPVGGDHPRLTEKLPPWGGGLTLEHSINTVSGREKIDLKLQGGFESVGHGVEINCETIRHRNFAISLPAIEMQYAMRFSNDEAKKRARELAKTMALHWAVQIENGKDPKAVLPMDTGTYLRSRVSKEINNEQVGQQRLQNEKSREWKKNTRTL